MLARCTSTNGTASCEYNVNKKYLHKYKYKSKLYYLQGRKYRHKYKLKLYFLRGGKYKHKYKLKLYYVQGGKYKYKYKLHVLGRRQVQSSDPGAVTSLLPPLFLTQQLTLIYEAYMPACLSHSPSSLAPQLTERNLLNLYIYMLAELSTFLLTNTTSHLLMTSPRRNLKRFLASLTLKSSPG